MLTGGRRRALHTCCFAALLCCSKPDCTLADGVPAFRYSMASASMLVTLVLAATGADAAGAAFPLSCLGLVSGGCKLCSAKINALQCPVHYFEGSDCRQGRHSKVSLSHVDLPFHS